MTPREALRVLGLGPNASEDEISEAFQRVRKEYVSQAQHGLKPEERDAATEKIRRAQDAYYTLTGNASPTSTPPQSKPTRRASQAAQGTTSGAAHARSPARAFAACRPSQVVGLARSFLTGLSTAIGRVIGAPFRLGRAVACRLQPFVTARTVTAVTVLAVCGLAVWLTVPYVASVQNAWNDASEPPPDYSRARYRRRVPLVMPAVAKTAVRLLLPDPESLEPKREPRSATVSIPQQRHLLDDGAHVQRPAPRPSPASHEIIIHRTPLVVDRTAQSGRMASDYGWLVLKTNPWARVHLDSVYLDDAPWLQPKRLPAGRHELTMATRAGVSRTISVLITSGMVTVVAYDFTAGRLTVRAVRQEDCR